VICGSLASLVAAYGSYRLRDKPWLVPLPPVVVNGVIIGGMLHFAYGVPNLLLCMIWVAAGQFLACYLLGYPLMKLLTKYKGIFK
ncbi:MAG: QueT transporter family protein, partial [Anaerovoracaceae bacterium]